MKKKKNTDFDAVFWSNQEFENPFDLLAAFYEYSSLETYKKTLGEAFCYLYKMEIYCKNYPGQLFIFYKAVRSFYKACYLLQFSKTKCKPTEPYEWKSSLHQASLSRDEYNNPFLVFERAFKEKTFEEYDFFLSEVVHLSLTTSKADFQDDLVTHYFHSIKMFDAAQLILERGMENIKS